MKIDHVCIIQLKILYTESNYLLEHKVVSKQTILSCPGLLFYKFCLWLFSSPLYLSSRVFDVAFQSCLTMNQQIFSLKHSFLPPLPKNSKSPCKPLASSGSLLPSFHPHQESLIIFADICIFQIFVNILEKATRLPWKCT